jgi:hypothetical protein
MGWLFSERWQTKSEMVRHLTRTNHHTGIDGGVVIFSTIKKCVRGNTLYAVQRTRALHATSVALVNTFISIYLMRSSKNSGGWGYKDMEESCGPCEHGCPTSYFDIVGPPPNEYAKQWRARCRLYELRKKVQPKVGETWLLRPHCRPKEVTITSVRPLRGSGYRIPRKLLLRPANSVGLITEPQHLTDVVRALAHGINLDQAFDRLPLLADAMEEAGFDCEATLDTLRKCERLPKLSRTLYNKILLDVVNHELA